jgi:hypothetical protein
MKITETKLRAMFPRLSLKDLTALHAALQNPRTTKELDDALEAANKILEGHGVEAIRGDWHDNYYCDIVGLYVNMGDPYIPTVYVDCVERSINVGDWGYFVETYSKKYGIL